MSSIPDRARFPKRADVAGDVAELIHSVNRRIRAATRAGLEPLGVTPAQARALRILAGAGRAVRMSELAAALRIARRSATSVVDELAARRLLTRGDDPDDRRAVLVDITPAGSDLVATMDVLRRDAGRRLTTALSNDELETMRALLRRLDED